MNTKTRENGIKLMKRLVVRIPLPILTLYFLVGAESANPKLAALAITTQILMDIFRSPGYFEAQTKTLLSAQPRKYLNTPERVQRAIVATEVVLLALCTLY